VHRCGCARVLARLASETVRLTPDRPDAARTSGQTLSAQTRPYPITARQTVAACKPQPGIHITVHQSEPKHAKVTQLDHVVTAVTGLAFLGRLAPRRRPPSRRCNRRQTHDQGTFPATKSGVQVDLIRCQCQRDGSQNYNYGGIVTCQGNPTKRAARRGRSRNSTLWTAPSAPNMPRATPYFGALNRPYGNRIGKAPSTSTGRKYKLAANNRPQSSPQEGVKRL